MLMIILIKLWLNCVNWTRTLAVTRAGAHANVRAVMLEPPVSNCALFDWHALTLDIHPVIQVSNDRLASARQGGSTARCQYFFKSSILVQGAKAGSAVAVYAVDSCLAVLTLTQALWSRGRIETGVDKAHNYDRARLQLLPQSMAAKPEMLPIVLTPSLTAIVGILMGQRSLLSYLINPITRGLIWALNKR